MNRYIQLVFTLMLPFFLMGAGGSGWSLSGGSVDVNTTVEPLWTEDFEITSGADCTTEDKVTNTIQYSGMCDVDGTGLCADIGSGECAAMISETDVTDYRVVMEGASSTSSDTIWLCADISIEDLDTASNGPLLWYEGTGDEIICAVHASNQSTNDLKVGCNSNADLSQVLDFSYVDGTAFVMKLEMVISTGSCQPYFNGGSADTKSCVSSSGATATDEVWAFGRSTKFDAGIDNVRIFESDPGTACDAVGG